MNDQNKEIQPENQQPEPHEAEQFVKTEPTLQRAWLPTTWPVARKIFALPVIAALSMLLVTGVSYQTSANLEAQFQRLTNSVIEEARTLDKLAETNETLLGELREYVLSGEDETLAEIREIKPEVAEHIRTYVNLNNFDRLSVPADVVQRVLTANAQLSAAIDQVLAAYQSGSEAALEETLENELEPAEQAFRESVSTARNIVDQILLNSSQNLQTELSRQRIILMITLSLGLLLIGGVTYFLYHSTIRRLRELVGGARQLLAGNFAARIEPTGSDEIMVLSQAFNLVTDQLKSTQGLHLDKAREQIRQFQALNQVGQRLSGILDLSDLLRELVALISEKFDYQHVHIYLRTGMGDSLMMTEGSGDLGAEMKRQAYAISLADSKKLVAYAAREGKIAIVKEEANHEPAWSSQRFLPDIKSEIAVPIRSAGEILGVLNLYGDRIDDLNEADEVILQALADQIAGAIRNARLFSETQDALYTAQHLQDLYTGEAWQKLMGRRLTDYEVTKVSGLASVKQSTTPEVVAALQRNQTVDVRVPVGNNGNYSEDQEPAQAGLHALATPLRLRNQVIGVLGIRDDDPTRMWTPDEISLIESVSEQMSLALENARLFEETGRRASRERIIADITQQVWASGELEEVIRTAAEQLGGTLDASKVIIRLGTQDQILPKPSS